jgi:phage terminase large subunit
MAVTVKISRRLYNQLYYQFLKAQQRVQIFFGGSSSGKSVFVAQRCIEDLMRGNRNYLCVRQTRTSLADSVLNELIRVIDRYNLKSLFNINESRLKITCANGYQAICRGLDDPEKIKSVVPKKGALTDIWVEEATETQKDSIKNIVKRLRGKAAGLRKRLTLTFNPILQSHWIYKDFFGKWIDGEQVQRTRDQLIVHSTYKDNRFLERDDIRALEDESDSYFYDVYTLGKWGVLGDIIFKNWTTADLKNDDISKTFDSFRYGLDFGFSNDPTAFNGLYYHKASRTLYVVDEWSDKEVTNRQIAEALKPRVNGNGSNVICDSAEPKSIKELNNYGLPSIGAKKGPDSILHGIQWLKQQNIVIDNSCVNTKRNFQQYHWKKNKLGEVLNVPVDKYNDHIDDIRYACEDLMMIPENFEIVSGDSAAAADEWNFE